jgi:hypothetical protein
MSSVPTALDFPRIVFNPRRVEIGLALTEGGTPNSVRFVRTDDSGQPITSFTISQSTDSAQLPSIALTPTGYALAWEELGPDIDGDGAADTARVVVATVTDEGDPASLPVALTDGGINGFDPSIVAVAGGLAVSYATVDGAGTREVRVQRVALNGTPEGAPITYATGVVRVRRTWAAGLPDGSVAVSWEEGDQDADLDVKAAVRCLE